MEEIIEHLGYVKQDYLRDVERLQKDLERELGYIDATEERITKFRERIRKAQAFIDQFDAAVSLLQEAQC